VSWKVTFRHGSAVEREKVNSLEQALAAARRRIEVVFEEGPPGAVEGFQTYEPGDQVHARVEISGPGLIGGAEGGIDVMGDGRLIPYTGAIRKRQLDGEGIDDALERLGAELS
jgi:hypothetical protein